MFSHSISIMLELKTAQRRLHQLQIPVTRLTGLTWEIDSEEALPVLVTEPPCRDKLQVAFVSALFNNELQLRREGEEPDYQIVEDKIEKTWQFRLLPQIAPNHIDRIQKYFRQQEVKHQGEQQKAREATEQLQKITGLPWQVAEREDCLSAPLHLLTPRSKTTDTKMFLKDHLSIFCQKRGFKAIDFQKTRLQGEPWWMVAMKELQPVLTAYYHSVKTQHQRERYRAKKMARKLTDVLEKGLCIDVEETGHFFDPVKLFVDCSLPQQIYLRQVFHDHRLLTGEWQVIGTQVTFLAKQLSLVKIEAYVEAHETQQLQLTSTQTQQQLAVLQTQLEQFIQLDNHQLRTHILTAVSNTETKLTRQVKSLNHRLVNALHERLDRFEVAVLAQLQTQGAQLDTLRSMITVTQEWLLDLHAQQQQHFETQQAWLIAQFENLSHSNFQSEVSQRWQMQMKALFTQQFIEQEQRLQTMLEAHASTEHAALEEILETHLDTFQTEFTQTQQAQWESYQTQLKHYMQEHLPTLEKHHHAIEQYHQYYALIEDALLNTIDTLSLDPATIRQSLSTLFENTAHAFPKTEIPWTTGQTQLFDLGDAVLTSREAIKHFLQTFLQQYRLQTVEFQAVKCIANTVASASATQTTSIYISNAEYFTVTFMRKSQESVALMQEVSQGIDTYDDVENVVQQAVDCTEIIASFLSIALPGIQLVAKATTFIASTCVNVKRQSFGEHITQFLQHESRELLFLNTAKAFTTRYVKQLETLSVAGIDALIDRYLLPCLLAEMAKARGETPLSTAEKQRCLILSAQSNPRFGSVKLTTTSRRKNPWTAAGLILGPSVAVSLGQQTNYYSRTDNPLWGLPWHPHSYAIYGSRLGDIVEVQQPYYRLLESTPRVLQAPSHEPAWQAQLTQTGSAIVDYFMAHPDTLDEQDDLGQSIWMLLTDNRLSFEIVLTSLIDYAEHSTELSQARLRASLLLTDHRERNFLHYYLVAQTPQILKSLTTFLPTLYQQLLRLGRVAEWDQQEDIQLCLPFDECYTAWKKTHDAAITDILSLFLSLWFSWSDQDNLQRLCSRYPMLELLNQLSFDPPRISPLLSLYRGQQKKYLLSLLEETTRLNDVDEVGNNLVHTLIQSNDSDFLKALFSRVNVTYIAIALAQENYEGETPLYLATKLHAIDLLWHFVRHEILMTHVSTAWKIKESQVYGKSYPSLSAVLKHFPSNTAPQKLTEKKSGLLGHHWAQVFRNTPTSIASVNKKVPVLK